MKKVKMICFDMDGTIADLYGVSNWLDLLERESPTPYQTAKPMWDMDRLATALNNLKAKGIEIRVITWLSKDSSNQYKKEVRKAKIEWLGKYNFPYDGFHGVRYGATKADSVRRFLNENETAILIDDSKKVTKGWTLGDTIDPTATDIVKYLEEMVK